MRSSSLNSLRVVEADPQSDSRWEAFVESHPDALVFHHPAWLAALEEGYGYRPHHLACEDEAHNVVGILPLVYKRGVVTGRTFSSLPHSMAAGPLASNTASFALLVEGAIARARDRRGARLQVRMSQPGLDAIAPAMSGRPGVVIYALTLTDRSRELRFGDARNHGAIKRAVQKAENAGVEIRAAENDLELRAWYRLYVETMRTHGAVPHSYRFLDALWRLLRPYGLVELLLAEKRRSDERTLLAGSLYLRWGRSTVLFFLNGSQANALSLRPNDAIHWRAIHDAWRQGFREYNLGGAEGNPGLARYKRKWGAERPLYRYYFPRPYDSTLALSRLDNRVARIATETWKHLPARAVERLGDLMHRHA
jgi:hypothetical protein